MSTNAGWPIIASCSGLCCHSNCGARVLSKRREGSKRRCLPFRRFIQLMKTRILLLLVITFTACASMAAQTEGVLREVTLYYFQYPEQPDRSRSSVNFETGERGPDRSGSFDLRYGGMAIGTPGTPGKPGKFLADWLGVLDCRSMVVDLGAKQWQDFKTTPPFPKP